MPKSPKPPKPSLDDLIERVVTGTPEQSDAAALSVMAGSYMTTPDRIDPALRRLSDYLKAEQRRNRQVASGWFRPSYIGVHRDVRWIEMAAFMLYASQFVRPPRVRGSMSSSPAASYVAFDDDGRTALW